MNNQPTNICDAIITIAKAVIIIVIVFGMVQCHRDNLKTYTTLCQQSTSSCTFSSPY